MRTIAIDSIDKQTFAPATKESFWIHALDLLAGPLLLPGLVATGTQPGPTLLVVAGVHGDEYEGMEAIRSVYAALDIEALSGRLLAVPVANPMAYEARARIAPLHQDGLNLARVFPGDPAGTPSRILAAKLLALVERNVGSDDLFLDFHSGSADVPYARLIGFRDVDHPATRRAEEAARFFGLPNLWRIPDGVGPFNAETARRGIPTLGTETTGRSGCVAADVDRFVIGLHGLLSYLGMTNQWPHPERLAARARTTLDVTAPATGFLRGARTLGERVHQGEALGQIIDLFGDPICAVTSPCDGELWAARSMPPVRTGELLYSIALPAAD